MSLMSRHTHHLTPFSPLCHLCLYQTISACFRHSVISALETVAVYRFSGTSWLVPATGTRNWWSVSPHLKAFSAVTMAIMNTCNHYSHMDVTVLAQPTSVDFGQLFSHKNRGFGLCFQIAVCQHPSSSLIHIVWTALVIININNNNN